MMRFKMYRDQTSIRFEGTIGLVDLQRLELSPKDQVLVNRASSGPQLEEDALRLLATLFQRERERRST